MTPTKAMHKPIDGSAQLAFSPDFPGLRGVNIMASQFAIEPFLVFTEFHMERPVFGPHPHAGVSVMTYLLPDSAGSFINRDSQGDFSLIEPGGAHIMQAGSGMHHDEFPKVPGVDCHGLQIWINHTDKQRSVEPRSMHASAAEIPEVISPDHTVRVVHGAFRGRSPKYAMVTPVTLLHVFLYAGKRIVLDANEMAFVYGLRGTGVIDAQAVSSQTLVTFGAEGLAVEVAAGEAGLEFMFATGTPHHEPIVYGGPFVMTTAEQMHAARLRLGRGEMGTLAPYAL